jgi:pilus assembly protein CpaB
VPIAINEPILAGKISGEGTNASIAALLPDGMRAASVRINDVSGVAGFVQPNDSVDVLITRQFSGGGSSQQVTDVLLQDVRVIAIGQNTQGAGGKPVVARNATLEVDPLAAQKLALAQEIGSLGLVLRKPGAEQNNPFVETVSLNDLRFNVSRAYRPATAPATAPPVIRAAPPPRRRATAPRPAPRPTTSNVEVVRGTAGNQYQVGNYAE